MSEQNTSFMLKAWTMIVFVCSRIANSIGTGIYFGQWGFGVGLLMGSAVGGVMFLTLKDSSMALAGGPIVGLCIGTACGSLFGLFTGAVFPQFADWLAKHPLFWSEGLPRRSDPLESQDMGSSQMFETGPNRSTSKDHLP